MKLVSSFIAVAMLTAIPPVQAATTDPLRLIYRASGVRDDGSASTAGVATVFHCTNFSAVTERVRLVVRNYDGAVVGSSTRNVASNETNTAETHNTALFTEDIPLLSPGVIINQGSVVISSTSLLVHCSAMIVDADVLVPQGIALHLARYNPAPNTQE